MREKNKSSKLTIFDNNISDNPMLTTIEGIYENGHVVFKEEPPLKKKAKVLITFMEDAEQGNQPSERPLGTMKGTIKMSDDFNDPISDLKEYM